MIDVPLAFAFGAGLVAAFNPCGAAMFPAYVGYQLDTARTEGNPIVAGLRGVAMALSVTAVFVLVFGIVSLVLAAEGRLIAQFLPFVGLGIGVIILGAGLYLLMSKRKLGIMSASRVNLGQGRGLRQTFLFGIAYALASLSRALPIFPAAVGIVAGQRLSAGAAAETIVGSISYGLGVGSVIMAATLGVVFFKSLITRGLRAVFPYIEPIGNLAMVGAGGYIIYYWSLGKGQDLLVLRAGDLF